MLSELISYTQIGQFKKEIEISHNTITLLIILNIIVQNMWLTTLLPPRRDKTQCDLHNKRRRSFFSTK